MSLEIFTQKVQTLAQEKSEELNATVNFATEEGVVFLDATKSPAIVNNDEGQEAACTIKLKTKDGIRMMDGNLSAVTAFMTGKLKITGDMGIAMKVSKIIG